MNLQDYLDKLNTRFRTGISSEHSYRGDLQNLIEDLCPGILATNEPSRIECGAPDYILTRKNIPAGYIEAKDMGADLSGKNFKDQFDRYRHSLPNLVFTNYLEFHLYRDGEFVKQISIGQIENGKVTGLPLNYDNFRTFIQDFSAYNGQTIRSAEKLSKLMAGKAKMLANVIENALENDEQKITDKVFETANNSLRDQLAAFRQVLIHDIKPKEFADIYSQTIAYGMFAARLHDPSLETFTRQEAAELIPKTNPFLRKLFQYVAGYDLDERIRWIVDALADIFNATDVSTLLKNFGKATQQRDPVIHFYETFLREYDPKLRKNRGVWYTPEPVVNFMVRAVDDILKTEFNLPQGLADTSKTTIVTDVAGEKAEQEVHRVQILDPAAGTGTFLAEVVKQVYKKFEGQEGIWSNYVENHLIPRLNGFELLMASYAMAHLKLDMLLSETGYKPSREQRFRIYLTNSLEEHHPDTGTLFANWLSTEANEANYVKRDTPVMVVIGNPPYSVSSRNKNKWIQNLIADYKKDLKERKINLDDDYIKFIRYGQYYIDKNRSGVLAYISNNSFLDGITHRQMRKHLLESFDKIYILNLHGDANKKEVCLDGSPDKNVFDIKQGVSINIFIKNRTLKKTELGKVFYIDFQGNRELKFNYVLENSINTLNWKQLVCTKPNLFFVPKNFDQITIYEKGFKVDELFLEFNTGIQTKRDVVTISFNSEDAYKIIDFFKVNEEEIIRKKYNLPEDGRDWTIKSAKKDLINSKVLILDILYRPFDNRKIIYTGKTKGIVAYPRHNTSIHLLKGENISLVTLRINGENNEFVCLITKFLIEKGSLAKGNYSFFPLYLYSEVNGQQTIYLNKNRIPNLNNIIVDQIAEKTGLTFTNEKEPTLNTFAPIDLLDYIYAVLHSPTYREKYKEFLKIDFPRVPYPKDKETFWQLVKLGGKLRQIHLLESPVVDKFITQYPVIGDNVVIKVKYENGHVYINDNQYFANVPQTAWEFYIGGYQPAQKWLKDRKGRVLNYEDILHYQKIIVALTETGRIMEEIDQFEIE